jgi:hypothetical protein
MATITLNYDDNSQILKQIITLAITAGAKPVDSETNPIAKQYERMFGKKETYTDNEIFVFNSMRNVQKILERDESKTA